MVLNGTSKKMIKLVIVSTQQTVQKKPMLIFTILIFLKKRMIQSHYIYPKEITRFYGARNTSVTRCFILQAENERTLFSFFNVGSIRLKTNQAASACNQS